MISLDNLRTVLNAIKRTLDSTKQDKLIAGKNITIAADGKTISAINCSDKILSVTITGYTDTEIVADKTYAEIKAAIDSGYPIHTIDNNGDIFVPRVNFKSDVERITLAWTERLDSNTWVEVVYEVNTQDSWGVTLREYVTPNEIGNLIALKTQAKDNLVVAINEVKQTTDAKQDKLIAGENITIAADGKTISATGGGASAFEINLLTNIDPITADKSFTEIRQAIIDGREILLHVDAKNSAKPVCNVYDDFIALTVFAYDFYDHVMYADYYECSNTNEWYINESRKLADYADIGDLRDLTTYRSNLVAAINDKQDKLIAGENITIAADGKTISATGGGGTTVELDTTLSTAGKAADAKATGDALAGKVDKVTGKGLSTNDYTNAAKAKVDAIPADPKYTDTVYDDTGVRNNMALMHDALVADSSRISTVEAKLTGHGSVTISDLTTQGQVEIYGDQPHIDFHYNNSTEDHTSRIIESASGKVDVLAANGLFSNGKKVALKSDLATSNITLTVNNNRLKDFSYTAKYVPVIPAVFVRAYGVVNADMNAGYDYDIINIGSNSPNWQTALSIKSAKNVMAVAKNSGVISIRPLEAGIKNYDVYIAGFWFV